MATEVLRPQDCLIQRIRVPPATAYHRRKTAPSFHGNPSSSICNYYSYNNNGFNYPNPNPNPNPRTSRRSAGPRRSSSADMTAAAAAPAPEKVTVLRRGESLDSKIKSEALRNDGNGSDSAKGPRRQIGDVYAGSAFAVVSPSPSSLPLPSFSKKKQIPMDFDAVDDSATRDLRRLLRIG